MNQDIRQTFNPRSARIRSIHARVQSAPRAYFHYAFATTILLGIVGASVREMLGDNPDSLSGALAGIFSHDGERNLMTLWNFSLISINVTIVSCIAVLYYARGDRVAILWIYLSVLFVMMAFDEAAQIHERLGRIAVAIMDSNRFGRLSWIIAAVPIVLVAGIPLIKLLCNIDPRSRNLMIFSGVVFVSGAIGFEIVGGVYKAHFGQTSTYYHIVIIEETMEMVGHIIFGYAALGYFINNYFKETLHMDV